MEADERTFPTNPFAPPSGGSNPALPEFSPVGKFVFNGGNEASFREKLLGKDKRRQQVQLPDLVAEKLVSVSLLDGDRLRPSISFADSVKNKLKTPWEEGLILKVLGRKVGFLALRDRLVRLWKLQGQFQLLDLGEGFFLAQFDRVEDREEIINGGPWVVFDRCLAVSRWTAEFSPFTCKIPKTMVWVRLPGLGLMYYNDSTLRIIASAIGKPVKVNENTLEVNRGKYARLCVEIDLDLPLISSVLIDGRWQRVEYEGLHLICTNCSCFGHVDRECPKRSSEVEQVAAVVAPDVGTTQIESESVGEDLRESGAGEDESMGVKESAVTPPQPEVGDWVVVVPRKKNNRRANGKARNLSHVNDSDLHKGKQKVAASNGTAKQGSPMAKTGGRSASRSLVANAQSWKGNGRGFNATSVRRGDKDVAQKISMAGDDGDLPGLKRHRPAVNSGGEASAADEDMLAVSGLQQQGGENLNTSFTCSDDGTDAHV